MRNLFLFDPEIRSRPNRIRYSGNMFARRLSIQRIDSTGAGPACPIHWIDNFAMRNFTNDALFDDTLPAADGLLEAGSPRPTRSPSARHGRLVSPQGLPQARRASGSCWNSNSRSRRDSAFRSPCRRLRSRAVPKMKFSLAPSLQPGILRAPAWSQHSNCSAAAS